MKTLAALLIILPCFAWGQTQQQPPVSVQELAHKLATEAAISAMRADEIETLKKQLAALREAVAKREKPKE